MVRPAHISWLLVAAAALLALDRFAPAARASCGDYVTIMPGGNHHQSKPAPTEPPCPCRHTPTDPGRSPCQGPWCSGSHSPLPTPVTTADQTQECWACWWAVLLLNDADSSLHPVPAVRVACAARGDAIFHPPRAVGFRD